MAQIRRVTVRANEKERMSVSIETLIVVQPGVLTRDEVDAMKKEIGSKLMVFLASEVPYLSVHLSDVKVTR